jgi:hypothetical protein
MSAVRVYGFRRRHRGLAGVIVDRQAMTISGLPGGAPLDLGLIYDRFTVQFPGRLVRVKL